jgi:hypothetical protein
MLSVERILCVGVQASAINLTFHCAATYSGDARRSTVVQKTMKIAGGLGLPWGRGQNAAIVASLLHRRKRRFHPEIR